MNENVIVAAFHSANRVTTRPAWLIDHGMVLKFTGIDLPEVYEVHFSNSRAEKAKTQIGNAEGVSIPDEYFHDADCIFAWLYLHSGEDDGFTAYEVKIPLEMRPDVTDEEPTSEQQSAIEQAIIELNKAVEKTAADVAEADAIVQDAKGTALVSEGYAVGEQDGEAVGAGSPYFENNAKFYSEAAQQAASEGGWVHFYIDGEGYLHYVKTPNAELEFYLQDGNLCVRT